MNNENVVGILSKLISCKSLTPEDDGCQKYIAGYLEKLGFEIIFVSKHNKIGLKNTTIKVQLLTKIEDLVEIIG